jgi:hypothetical protein
VTDPPGGAAAAPQSRRSDATTDAERREERRFLDAIAERGVATLLRNGRGLVMHLHVVGEDAIPVVVSDGEPGKASITSPTGHYLEYPLYEMSRHLPVWRRRALHAATLPLRVALRLGRFDRVAYVNHWLFVGGPPLRLAPDALGALVDDLVRTHPDHALVFSGIVPCLEPDLARDLVDLGGRAVRSRTVNVVRPGMALDGGAMKHVRQTRSADAARLRANEHRRTDDRGVLLAQLGRLRDLYAQLYLGRHPRRLNPQYDEEFFRLLIESRLFRACAWIDESGGIVEAFDIQYVTGGVLRWSTCGVDLEKPRSHGLFRLVVAQHLATGEREQAPVNLGGGNDAFKRHRGAEPHREFDVVFDRHLPAYRRAPWQLVQCMRSWRHGRRAARRDAPG